MTRSAESEVQAIWSPTPPPPPGAGNNQCPKSCVVSSSSIKVYKAHKLAPSLNAGRTPNNSMMRQKRPLWDKMQRKPNRNKEACIQIEPAEVSSPQRCPLTPERSRKKQSERETFQGREGRNDSLKMELVEDLKKEENRCARR